MTHYPIIGGTMSNKNPYTKLAVARADQLSVDDVVKMGGEFYAVSRTTSAVMADMHVNFKHVVNANERLSLMCGHHTPFMLYTKK